jgi:hypothetical protein
VLKDCRGVVGGPAGDENGGKGELKDCRGVVEASRGVELWCGGVNDEVMSTNKWPLWMPLLSGETEPFL